MLRGCHIVLLSQITLLAGCGPGVDRVDALCRNAASCQTPPPGECVTPGMLQTYRTPGSCNVDDGTCSYEKEERSCEHGCFDATRCKTFGDLLWQTDEVTGDDLGTRGQQLAIADDGSIIGIGDKKHLWSVSPEGKLQWSLQLGEEGDVLYDRSTPSLDSQGNIYLSVHVRPESFGAEELWVYGVSPTGEKRWHDFPDMSWTDALRAAPAIGSDDHLYLVHGGSAHKYSPAGELVWVSLAGYGLWSVLSVEDHLFASHGSNLGGVMMSLDSSGEERWSVDLPLTPPITRELVTTRDWPVIRPDGVILQHLRDLEADSPSRLIAVDAADGALLWSLEKDSQDRTFVIHSNAVVSPSNETFFFSRTYESDLGHIYRVAADGTLAASFVVEELTLHSLILLQGDVLLAVGQLEANVSPKDFLLAFDSEGKQLFETALPAPLYGLAVDQRGMIYGYNSFGLSSFVGDRPLSTPGWPKRGADRKNTRRATKSP